MSKKSKAYESTTYVCPCGYQIQNNDIKLIMMKRRLHRNKCSEKITCSSHFFADAKLGESEHNINVRQIESFRDFIGHK